MYHLSRALYRDISRCLPDERSRSSQERILHACETTMQRLVSDPHYFAHPARTLFQEIRFLFPMAAQARVWRTVQAYVGRVVSELERRPHLGHELTGTKPECQATTRRGAPCQRDPLPGSRYCPSHQHLEETEEVFVEREPALAA